MHANIAGVNFARAALTNTAMNSESRPDFQEVFNTNPIIYHLIESRRKSNGRILLENASPL